MRKQIGLAGLFFVGILAIQAAAGSFARAEVIATYGEGWAEVNDGLKTLHLKGSEREMGRQYGYFVADEIENMLNVLRETAIKQEPKVKLLPNWAFRGIRRVLGWVWWTTFPKNVKDHLEGIIEGGKLREKPVKITKGDLGFINGLIDIAAIFRAGADSIESQVPGNPSPSAIERAASAKLLQIMGLGGITVNCDTFAAWGSRTVDGKTFQTRNVDVPTGQGLETHPLIVVYKPEGKIPFVTAAVSGIVGLFTGMNAEGVAMGQVWAFSRKIGLQTPWQLQMRDVMMHARTGLEARDRMLSNRTLAYGSNFVLAGSGPADGWAIEGNAERMAWFGANDPRESELKFNGESVNIPLDEVVFRADVAFDPKVRSQQTAGKGPNGDPREAGSYKKRYKGQSDIILEYEAQGTKIGKVEAERISRDTAMRGGSMQVAVYANTDRDMWVAYSRMNPDGTVTQAYEREYQNVPFWRYLLEQRPDDTRYEIRILRDGRAIESGRWVAGYDELMQEVKEARSRASQGDLVEVLGAGGERLELFKLAPLRG
jgi:hypothetical protein